MGEDILFYYIKENYLRERAKFLQKCRNAISGDDEI